MAKSTWAGLFGKTTAGAALFSLGLLLSGCVNNTPMDDLEYAQPDGVTAFDEALYKNYAFLAHSFGDLGQASHSVFDFSGSTSLNTVDAEVAELANAFAAKAVTAAKGEFVDPEPARNPEAHDMRDRLMRALEQGREAFPRDAARAQADYDCWMLNARVPSQKAAADRCRASFDVTLKLAETDAKITPPTAAAPAPAAPPAGAQPAAPPTVAAVEGTYIVYFDFDSWSLTAEQLKVLDEAAKAARSGSKVKVRIVGHSDTSGQAGYNMQLSVRRANIVKEALISMGVKKSAIRTSGVGEADLAVETGDDVREPRNRRSVVTLSQ